MEFYIGHFNNAMGDAANIDAVQMEADARKIFAKHGVAQDVVDAIIEHEKQRLGVR